MVYMGILYLPQLISNTIQGQIYIIGPVNGITNDFMCTKYIL